MYNKEGFLELGVSPEQAPDKAEYITLTFERVFPQSLTARLSTALNSLRNLTKSAAETASVSQISLRTVLLV